MTDGLRPSLARTAGAALLVACLLLLAYAAALVAEDRSTLTTLLVVFALVSVPALVSALLGLRAAAALLQRAEAERGAPVYAGLLALGHAGIAALSLSPGLDRALDRGDLLGAGAGTAGLVGALAAVALLAHGRTLAVRLTAAAAAVVLVLAVLAVRAVAGTR